MTLAKTPEKWRMLLIELMKHSPSFLSFQIGSLFCYFSQKSPDQRSTKTVFFQGPFPSFVSIILSSRLANCPQKARHCHRLWTPNQPQVTHTSCKLSKLPPPLFFNSITILIGRSLHKLTTAKSFLKNRFRQNYNLLTPTRSCDSILSQLKQVSLPLIFTPLLLYLYRFPFSAFILL